ncbi:MAG: RsmD family RNA methyltransferase [Firmicutes bacterium]|nr:RsmD family RNA methyltransferase [Bacillota bacterium]
MRIIAGSARGRNLKSPRGMSTRPSPLRNTAGIYTDATLPG